MSRRAGGVRFNLGPARRPARVAARDGPPDPAATGPSDQDIEDMLASQDDGWLEEYDPRSQASEDEDLGPFVARSGAGPPPAEDADGQPMGFLTIDDNPPPPARPAGSDPAKATYGIEFEFLLAVCSRVAGQPNPHPAEDRWLSTKAEVLAALSSDAVYEYTVRNRCVDALRSGGIVANKTAEGSISVPGIGARGRERDLDHLRSYEDVPQAVLDEVANNNTVVTTSFVPPTCEWDPAKDENANVSGAVGAIMASLERFHAARGILLHRTWAPSIAALAAAHLVLGSPALRGGWTARAATRLAYFFEQRAMDRIRQAEERWETARRDPLHVDIPGMRDAYRAWHVTEDVSVDVGLIQIGDYRLPPGWAPPEPRVRPPNLYKWWGAEVVTPVYDIQNGDCFKNVVTAVTQLRNELRIHKPLSAIGDGLHIHFGHQEGWSLLQLKRVASLWWMIEDNMYSLLRQERSTFMYCQSMRRSSCLSKALFGADLEVSINDRYLPNGGTVMNAQYDQYMSTRVPLNSMDDSLKKFVINVWRFPTIDALKAAMGNGDAMGDMGIRWYVKGDKRTAMANWYSKQTLEFRQLQGTLDSQHVFNWMSVCYAFIHFCRNATDREFFTGMDDLCQVKRNMWQVLDIPQDRRDYFQRNLDTSTIASGRFWVYPDRNRVDWSQPFMVRGAAAVH